MNHFYQKGSDHTITLATSANTEYTNKRNKNEHSYSGPFKVCFGKKGFASGSWSGVANPQGLACTKDFYVGYFDSSMNCDLEKVHP